ncbi:helix-turn-helix transcriptional regulator [Azotobacter chroococcum]|uniref:AlpA family phage regulatory protein n=1 Tax=Azotobacter chroococcum TaxID=353 RepID=A0AAP9YAT2_9GAMM|nr:AlpA family phage regulatory protein [Azotobacter chroococcum]QQE87905.1 AlpA family phage regulatory protein [Azotobacter chroococcum]TKD44783.1 AlpA family phage regulatory protein [Azotobacter chroococcum]
MARTATNSRKQPEQAAASTAQARRFIKVAEVRSLTTLSTSEIYRRIAAGTFPAQIMLGPKSAVWIESEVLAWCEARIAESRGEAA